MVGWVYHLFGLIQSKFHCNSVDLGCFLSHDLVVYLSDFNEENSSRIQDIQKYLLALCSPRDFE